MNTTLHLFHVTLKKNINSIYERGIDPEFSKGKRKQTWLVSEGRIPWALSHCSVRHDCKVSDLVIMRVMITDRLVKNTRLSGIVTTDRIVNAWVYAYGDEWIESESAIND